MFKTFQYALILLFASSTCTHAQPIILGSFNLRYDNPRDSGNLWHDRMPMVVGLLRFHDFDILGTQEGLSNQLEDIGKEFKGYYYWYGVGRDDGDSIGEHSAIFYKKERFDLRDKGDFWLSQTPGKPSFGWDAKCCKRLCSWVKLYDRKSHRTLWVFNAHFDHEGKTAREESSKLVLKKIKEIAGDSTVVFTGDLNGGQSSSWYKRIAQSGWLFDTYERVEYPYAYNPSYQAFGKKLDDNEIIDHIFTTRNLNVKRWGILSDSYHGKFPSDHFPVLAEVE